MPQIIQIKRGLKANLPILLEGELGFCKDTKEIYIGDGTSNILKGQQGLKGDQGIQGIKGDTGPQGIQGVKGDTGLTGNVGAKGDEGIQGIQGLKGDKGLTGNAGYTPIKNTDYFDGEKGDKGDTGSQGIQGIQGLPGNIGNTGAKGDQGVQGIQGIIGLTGAKGDQGTQGNKGADGLTTSVKLGATQYNQSGGIVSLPAYPTSLPANGGNAATVGGNLPSSFAPSGFGLGSSFLRDMPINDCNDAIASGFYYATGGANSPSQDGHLLVMAYSDVWKQQMFWEYSGKGLTGNPGRLFMRHMYNGVWQEWYEFAKYNQIPTKTSQIANDSGFITSSGSGARITTNASAPSTPSPGDFWYKEI